MANFKDGVIRDGNSLGSGQALGNIKDGSILAKQFNVALEELGIELRGI